MNINLKATNIELTPSIKDYVEKKLKMIDDKLVDPGDQGAICDVEVGKTTRHHKTGDIFKAEFNMHVAGKHFYFVAEKDSLYAAIDEAKDEAERALSRHKGKRQTLRLKGGSKIKNILRKFKW